MTFDSRNSFLNALIPPSFFCLPLSVNFLFVAVGIIVEHTCCRHKFVRLLKFNYVCAFPSSLTKNKNLSHLCYNCSLGKQKSCCIITPPSQAFPPPNPDTRSRLKPKQTKKIVSCTFWGWVQPSQDFCKVVWKA